MNTKRLLFICRHMGWNVKDAGSRIVLERASDKINGYYDRKRPDQPLVYSVFVDKKHAVDDIRKEYEAFDASEFAWVSLKWYEDKCGQTPPVLTYSDFAKLLKSYLEKLSGIVEDNEALSPYEEKILSAAEGAGFSALIKKSDACDTFWFELESGENITASVVKTRSLKRDAERVRCILKDIDEGICIAERKASRKNTGGDAQRNCLELAEKGKNLKEAITEAFSDEL